MMELIEFYKIKDGCKELELNIYQDRKNKEFIQISIDCVETSESVIFSIEGAEKLIKKLREAIEFIEKEVEG